MRLPECVLEFFGEDNKLASNVVHMKEPKHQEGPKAEVDVERTNGSTFCLSGLPSGLDFSSPVVLSIKHRRGQHYEHLRFRLAKILSK